MYIGTCPTLGLANLMTPTKHARYLVATPYTYMSRLVYSGLTVHTYPEFRQREEEHNTMVNAQYVTIKAVGSVVGGIRALHQASSASSRVPPTVQRRDTGQALAASSTVKPVHTMQCSTYTFSMYFVRRKCSPTAVRLQATIIGATSSSSSTSNF